MSPDFDSIKNCVEMDALLKTDNRNLFRFTKYYFFPETNEVYSNCKYTDKIVILYILVYKW